MKRLSIVFILLIVLSCSKDPKIIIPDDGQSEQEPEITTPCDFNLSEIEEGTTKKINCAIDLKGETITLASNVSFDYDGGTITNGKLVFSGGKIDGKLLNHKLEIEGDVKLKDKVFSFLKSKWDLTEGKTTSDIALENTAKLESLFFFIKKLGGETFKIDQLDAFFEVTKVTSTTTNQNWYPSLEAVNLPSNFNLIMTDNTHLRIFPGDKYNRRSGAILAVRETENITITGGNFYGDRDERVFSADDPGIEGSHLLHIHSGKNITVDGIKFKNGSSGTIAIYSTGFSFNPNYDPTENVTIKNCLIENSRRMGIALVDGRNVTIENNTFIDIGQPSEKTDGGEVGYAINIEPDRFRDPVTGLIKERQRVFDVLIKGNTERNSRIGFLTLTIGQDITVEDNTIGTRLVSSFISGAKIRKNKFKALGKATESWAMFIAGSGETVFNNEISENTIEGYSAGIIIGSYDSYVHHNTIKDCATGIQFSDAKKSRVYNNTIDVRNNGIQATNTTCDEIELKGNTVTTSGNYTVYFAQMNNKPEDQDKKVVFDENNVFENNKVLIFSKASGVIFNNNVITGGVSINNANNFTLSKNKITPNESHGIRLYNSLNNVMVTDNIVSKPTGTTGNYNCLENDTSTPSGVTVSGNSCN